MQGLQSEVLARHNVAIRGAGEQPMLFAHGFGCDQNMWRFVAPAFEEHYRVVLFDYIGSGKSDLTAYEPSRYSSLEGYSQDVLDIAEALDLRDIIFVGHSVSSMIGALAALKQPERFAHLIMVGPSPCYLNDQDYVGGFAREDLEGLLSMMEKNYIGWASYLAPAIMQNAERPELAAELQESFCSTDPVIARRFAEATFFSDNRADLPRITTPTLVMQCSSDIIAPECVGEFVHRSLPHSTYALMRATGHCPQMSHPEETVAVIKGYLDG